MMGDRVPVDLRVFLTAAAIVDDLGTIVAVAAFYSSQLHPLWLLASLPLIGALGALNRAHVYIVPPYIVVGVALWACVLASGLHPTLAGVILALFIPTRPPADLKALTTQANAIVLAEAARGGEVLRHGPSAPALRTLDAIHDRILSPADRLLRTAGARSSYLVLPVFALANAGVAFTGGVFEGRSKLFAAIVLGLVVGKPLGIVSASALAVWLKAAVKPERLFLGAALRRRRARRHRLHHVALHRRPGLSEPGRFRGGEDRRLRGLRFVGGDRRRGAPAREARAGDVTRLSATAATRSAKGRRWRGCRS